MKKIIGIIGGKGKMGVYFEKFFKSQGFKVIISDKNTKISNIELAKKADIVIISVPISKTVEVIREIGQYVKKDALLMDLTSVKKEPLKAMLEYSSCAVLGCHPMFGPTNLIKGQIIIFSSGRGKKYEIFMRKLFESGGAIVKNLDAKKHDEIMASVQGIAHFLSFCFPHAISKSKIEFQKLFEFQTPVYRVVSTFLSRYLDQDPNLYASIQIENPETKKAVRNFLNSGEEFLKIVENKDFSGFLNFAKIGKNYLGNFTKKAQQESDEIIDALAIKIAKNHEKNFWKNQPKKADIAILGPKGTYTHLAAEKFLPEKTKIFCRTIEEIFETIENKKADFGFLPIENKLNGPVNSTFDGLFQSSNLQIYSVAPFQIEHVFAILPSAKKSLIKNIYSHSQALGQCCEFLKKNFSKAVKIPVSSTSEAVDHLLKTADKFSAAICSAEAANNAKLEIVAKNIADIKYNETFFALIAKPKIDNLILSDMQEKFKRFNKVSIAFILKNKPGALFDALRIFADTKINLTKINSRFVKNSENKFSFFVDFEGLLSEQRVKKALKELKSKTTVLKVLGSW